MSDVAGSGSWPGRTNKKARVGLAAGMALCFAMGQQVPANAAPAAPSQPVTSATRAAPSTAAGPLNGREIAALSAHVSDRVIVLLQDQPPMARPGTRASKA